MKLKIKRVIGNVHMGQNHVGLKTQALEVGEDPATLSQGEMLVFLNGKRTKMKILDSSGNVLGYYSHPTGRIPLEAIHFIPKAFGAKGFDMPRAIKLMLQHKLSGLV